VYAELVPPCRRAREEQIGDVRAGDQQHERDHRHDRQHRLAVAVAHRRRAASGGLQRERLREITCFALRASVGRDGCLADLRLHAAQRLLRRR
jgi:hypothetical protein